MYAFYDKERTLFIPILFIPVVQMFSSPLVMCSVTGTKTKKSLRYTHLSYYHTKNNRFLGNRYKFLGHDDYPIPVITSHPQGEWMDAECK